jgi:hypothetical protein
MTWSNEEKGDNGQPKKSELLPTGDKAKEIVEVLAAMYRAMQNPEDATNDEDRSEHANQ